MQALIEQVLEGKLQKDDEEKKQEELEMPALEMPVQMVTAWKCPACKLFYKIEDEVCAQCEIQLQFYESQGVPIEEMIFEVEPDLLHQAKQQDKDNDKDNEKNEGGLK